MSIARRLCYGIVGLLFTGTACVADDAPLPAALSVPAVFDVSSAQRWTTPARDRICINGLWRFWPAGNGDKIPAAGSGWCWMKVPGSWPASHRSGHNPFSFEPLLSDKWRAVLDEGVDRGDWRNENRKRLEGIEQGQWIKFDEVDAAWYQREVQIPATWNGRAIYLILEDVERISVAFINGESVGRVDWPAGELDISRFAVPGQKAVISIIVKSEKRAGLKGLAGDVYLESRPRDTVLENVYFEPSVKNKQLTVHASVRGGLPPGSQLSAAAFQVGKQVRSFAPVAVTSPKNDGELQATFDWPDPELWEPEHPVLYDMQLQLQNAAGGVIDAPVPVRLGFREITIHGRDILLNGRKLLLSGFIYPDGRTISYCTAQETAVAVKRIKSLGYNLAIGSIYRPAPGLVPYPKQFLRTCDELGLFFQMQLPSTITYAPKDAKGLPQFDTTAMQAWQKDCEVFVRRYREHPSILMWSTNQGMYASADMNNPRHWAQEKMPMLLSSPNMPQNMFKLIEGAEEILMKIDPTRPSVQLGNGGISDRMVSVYLYPNVSPVQEVAEYPSLWAEQGIKPLMMSEWGMPMLPSLTSHRTNNPGPAQAGRTLDPLMVEFDAQRRGDAAYQLTAQHDLLYGRLGREQYTYDELYNFLHNLQLEQGFLDTQARAVRQVVPIWRAMGVTLIQGFDPFSYWPTAEEQKDYWPRPTDWEHLQTEGVKPDYLVRAAGIELHLPESIFDKHYRRTSFANAWAEMMQPVLCFLGGDEKADGALANQQHHYYVGDTLRKTAVLLNNTAAPVTRKAIWSLQQGERIQQTGVCELTAKPGGLQRQEISLKLPESGRYKLCIEFVVADGVPGTRQELTVDVFPKLTATALKHVTVYDPEQTTIPALRRLGIEVQPVDATNADVPAGATIVFGENALKADSDLGWLSRASLPAKILILAQQGEVVGQRLGFRYGDQTHRHAFPRWPAHPILAGIAPENLVDFSGSGKLVEAYPDWTRRYHYETPSQSWLGMRQKRMYRWGNTGSVASRALFKPEIGNFTTLVDAGFDLNEAALLLLDIPDATVLLCQMEVANRTLPDPAADRVLLNCLEWLDAAAGRKDLGEAMVLHDSAATVAKQVGISSKTTNSSGLSEGKVLLLSAQNWPDEGSLENIRAWVQQGGKLVALGASGEQLTALLSRPVSTLQMKRDGDPFTGTSAYSWRGIGPGDLFWHGPVEYPMLTSFPGLISAGGVLGDLSLGKGSVVVCQVSPASFGEQPLATQKRAVAKTTLLVRTLLTNAGCASSSPFWSYLLSAPAKDEERWNKSYYSQPVAPTDDPYRYQNW